MLEETRFFHHRDRAQAPNLKSMNQSTMCLPPIKSLVHEPFDAKRLYVERYASIQEAMRRHKRVGVLLLAFDQLDRPLAEGWLEASLDRTRAAIIGRHSRCSIPIPDSHSHVSLRHVALLVRATSHEDVRIRLLDLHTGIAFADESGRVLQALTSDGPFFFSIGRVRYCALVTGGTELPADAEQSYSWIPERVFLGEREGPYVPKQLAALAQVPNATSVTMDLGPIGSGGRLCPTGEVPVARVHISGAGMSVSRDISETALRRGILVGRYSRCDVRTGADSESVSRVHALIVREGRHTIIADVASTNGSWAGGREFSSRTLEDGDHVSLAHVDGLELAWQVLKPLA